MCYEIAVNLIAFAAREEIQPLSWKFLLIAVAGLMLAVVTATLVGDDDCPPGPNDNPWDFT